MNEERETVDLATYDAGKKVWIEQEDGTIVSVLASEYYGNRK